jgi:hypothetical protein
MQAIYIFSTICILTVLASIYQIQSSNSTKTRPVEKARKKRLKELKNILLEDGILVQSHNLWKERVHIESIRKELSRGRSLEIDKITRIDSNIHEHYTGRVIMAPGTGYGLLVKEAELLWPELHTAGHTSTTSSSDAVL